MASSVIKGVGTLLLTPLKSSLNFASSPIDNKRKFLSATSIKSKPKSPRFESRCCKTLKHSPELTENQSHHFKAARRLFSSPRPSKGREQLIEKCYLNTHKICCHAAPPLFDTPLRRSISTSQFYKNTCKRFILGRGSYGIVVEGRYKNKNLAVKIISQCRKQNDVLKSEMNALKLNHPHVIRVHQVAIEPTVNTGFVFMELYSRVNLETVLQNQSLHLLDKIRYLKQVASALEFCHSNSILHLDVKPKNIVVDTGEKTCKLCDFGSSVDMLDLDRLKNPRKGTLKYFAPELLQGNDPTEKADVYSFGITMWQTIHQEMPYGMEDLQQVVYKVVKHSYRPKSCQTVASPSVQQIYEACWQADPVLRPPMRRVAQLLDTSS